MYKLKLLLLDILFPPRCSVCDKLGFFVCPECERQIFKVTVQTCPACNKISSYGKYCPRCRPKYALFGLVTFGNFKDPLLKAVLHDFKYNGIYSLSTDLAGFIISKIQDENIYFDLLAFVPITKSKERKRGYNQSKILAKEIATSLDKSVFLGLIKIKKTQNQVGLTAKERRLNLKDAFDINGNEETLKNKTVLLIDDVFTTGSTLNECAKVLKTAGAKRVIGAVVAKE